MQEISKHTHTISEVVTCGKPGLVLPLGKHKEQEHSMAVALPLETHYRSWTTHFLSAQGW